MPLDLEKWRHIRRVSERHERWLFSTYINRPVSILITSLLGRPDIG